MSGHMTAKLSRPTGRPVNPALVQGQSMILTWGDLAARLKGRRHGRRQERRGEKSAEVVVARSLGARGPPLARRTKRNGACTFQLSVVFHRSPRASAELSLESRVKPNSTAKCGTGTAGDENTTARRSAHAGSLNVLNRRMRTRMSGGVGGLEARPTRLLPIPILNRPQVMLGVRPHRTTTRTGGRRAQPPAVSFLHGSFGRGAGDGQRAGERER